MNMPPSTSVQPLMFQAPGSATYGAAKGTKGEKFSAWKLPLKNGTTPTTNRVMTMIRPTTVCTLAVARMPRCWMAKASSIRIAPMTKVKLKESDTTSPNGMVKSVQPWIGIRAAVAAASSTTLPEAAWVAMYSAIRAASGVGSIRLRM